jgi:CrcB protein
MQALLMVGAGGALGAICRYLLGVQAMRMLGTGWPFGTYAANILGGLLMGVLAGVLAYRGGPDQEKWRLLVGVGMLGGFTTFSAFSLETALMIDRKAWLQVALYVGSSVVFSVGAIAVGRLLVRRLLA